MFRDAMKSVWLQLWQPTKPTASSVDSGTTPKSNRLSGTLMIDLVGGITQTWNVWEDNPVEESTLLDHELVKHVSDWFQNESGAYDDELVIAVERNNEMVCINRKNVLRIVLTPNKG